MRPVSTAVNKRQWGVPMPDGVMLETLREELLATLDDRLPEAGIEYCWLDVLCLVVNIYHQPKFVASYNEVQ